MTPSVYRRTEYADQHSEWGHRADGAYWFQSGRRPKRRRVAALSERLPVSTGEKPSVFCVMLRRRRTTYISENHG